MAILLAADSLAADALAPKMRPLTDRKFEVTAERLERGRYFAENLLQCFICHTERDWDRPGAPPIASRKGSGAVLSRRGDRWIVAPNITPDVETGAGGWTDDMLARAIREGIGHDGRGLFWGMWYQSFAALSDEDLAAVVVYLRSIPPVRNVLPRTVLPPEEALENARNPRPITAPVAGPAPDDTLARGRYLVNLADCAGCHTSWHSTRNPGLMAGGNLIERGARSAYSTNITSHASGAGYTADTFATVIRTGKGGSLNPIMPWIVFRGLSDEDLAAIHATLGRVPPVAHYIGNFGKPAHCDVCGQVHPLGEYNRIELPIGVRLEPAQLERLAGRFHSVDLDSTLTFRHETGRLYGVADDGPEIELIPQSETRFIAPGWVAPVEFALGADGRSSKVVSLEIDRIPFDRVP